VKRQHLVLLSAALVLACVAVAGGVLAYLSQDDRDAVAQEKVEQRRYGIVLAAARDFGETYMDLDYRTGPSWVEEVSQLATGTFGKQFDEAGTKLTDLATQGRSVREGDVESAAVSSFDQDSAIVLVATSGVTTSSVNGERERVQTNFRLLLTLNLVDGDWLVANVEPVG
jgi:Mce-associated membrane protein